MLYFSDQLYQILWQYTKWFEFIQTVVKEKFFKHSKKSFVSFSRDNGTCTQCVAFLFSLTSFWERHRDRGTEVGTDTQCVWNKPRIRNPTPRRSSTRGWTRHKTDPQPTAVTCTKDSSTQFYRLRDPNPTLRRSYTCMNLLRYWCSCFADFWKWWWYRDDDYVILPTMADACKIRQPPFDILSITENLKKVFD